MKSNLSRLVGAGLALGVAMPSYAVIGPILIDRDGTAAGTGAILADVQNYSNDSFMLADVFKSDVFAAGLGKDIDHDMNDEFNAYLHSRVSNWTVVPGGPAAPNCNTLTDECSPVGGEWTMVTGFRMEKDDFVEGGAGNATWSANLDTTPEQGDVNYFKIFYDPAANADPLLGTGYDDGLEILTGRILTASTGFTLQKGDVANRLKLDGKGIPGTPDTWDGADSPLDPLDGGPGAVDSDGSGYAREAVGTYEGNGGLQFTVEVLDQNDDFFLNDLRFTTILEFGLDLTTQTITNHQQVTPSERVGGDPTASGLGAFYNPGLNTETPTAGDLSTGWRESPASPDNDTDTSLATRLVNRERCANVTEDIATYNCDFISQARATSKFNNVFDVAAPESLGLLGIGLAAMGFATRRRRLS